MSAGLKAFEEALTGGFEHNVLHLVTVKAEPDAPPNMPESKEIVMVMMDMEYDPVRITFDSGSAGAYFHADGNKWCSFTPEQLKFIAAKSKEAERMWRKYFDENPE